MRVIAKRTLREFYQQPKYRDARGPLEAWHAEAMKAAWRTPHDIKARIGSASIITDSLVVFRGGQPTRSWQQEGTVSYITVLNQGNWNEK